MYQYYCTIITDTAQSIYGYVDRDGAEERYHAELSYAMNQKIACTCIVQGKNGAQYLCKAYVPPVTEQE